jgi:hypothetical protein
MNLSLLVLWAVAGWCGWRGPLLTWGWPLDPPAPAPREWPKIVGTSRIFGIIGGWLFTQLFPCPPMCDPALAAAASSVGAFLLARFVMDICGVVCGRRKP